MPRRLQQSGRGGRGRGEPPAYTRTNENPLRDPTVRAHLRRAILPEHEQQTGETPWNNNRGNILRVDDTGVVITLKWLPQVNLAYDQRVPAAWPVLVNNTGRHRQELLNEVADMRTKLLKSYFFLIYIQTFSLFLTYI